MRALLVFPTTGRKFPGQPLDAAEYQVISSVAHTRSTEVSSRTSGRQLGETARRRGGFEPRPDKTICGHPTHQRAAGQLRFFGELAKIGRRKGHKPIGIRPLSDRSFPRQGTRRLRPSLEHLFRTCSVAEVAGISACRAYGSRAKGGTAPCSHRPLPSFARPSRQAAGQAREHRPRRGTRVNAGDVAPSVPP